jgi:FkbM family methyltransferase
MSFSKLNAKLFRPERGRWHILAQKIYLKGRGFLRDEETFKTYFGATMVGNVSDYILARVFSFGVWEPNLSRFMTENIQTGAWVVDVGSNVGYFTLLMSKLVGATGKVFAIEASPQAYAELLRNLDRNDCTNVTSLNLAVSDRVGSVKLYDSPWGARNSGMVTTIASRGAGSFSLVRSDTLFGLIGEAASKISFIKIDIEGAERPVLKQILENKDRFARNFTLVTEVGDDNLDLVDEFLDAGFKCFVLENDYGFGAYFLGDKALVAPKPWAGNRAPAADLIFQYNK